MATKKTEVVKEEVKEQDSLLPQLIAELSQDPESALRLVQTLGKITKPWEIIGLAGSGLNEVPVPPGKSAKEFQKSMESSAHISGYRLETIFGEEIALIVKDSPKWKITILGEYQVDAPFISHVGKAESAAKTFAEDKLLKRGYIINR